MYLLSNINQLIALGSLGMLAGTVLLAVDYFLYNGRYCADRLKEYLWPLIVFSTVGSVVMSLVYSEYFGFIPCSLCWLQRIAIYPQALLSLVALKLGDGSFFPKYGIALSVFGFIVAVYQYIEQMLPHSAGGILPCLADGSADCAEKVFEFYGFITFPFVSAVTFFFLIMLYLYVLRGERATA